MTHVFPLTPSLMLLLQRLEMSCRGLLSRLLGHEISPALKPDLLQEGVMLKEERDARSTVGACSREGRPLGTEV